MKDSASSRLPEKGIGAAIFGFLTLGSAGCQINMGAGAGAAWSWASASRDGWEKG